MIIFKSANLRSLIVWFIGLLIFTTITFNTDYNINQKIIFELIFSCGVYYQLYRSFNNFHINDQEIMVINILRFWNKKIVVSHSDIKSIEITNKKLSSYIKFFKKRGLNHKYFYTPKKKNYFDPVIKYLKDLNKYPVYTDDDI